MSRILVVEDDKASWDVLSRLLLHHAFTVDIAKTATDALAMLEQMTYDMVIVDLALPGMDGWQLLGTLQAKRLTDAMVPVAITAYYDPQVAQQARAAGFVECYPKPASMKLIESIKQFL